MRVKLSDVTKYAKGTQINRDDLIENGQYIYLNGGINPSGRWNDANVKGNTVTISEGGNSSGYVNYMTEPFWCGAHCYYLFDGPKNTRYLYYALKSQQERLFSIRSGACMPNIKKADLGKFEFEFDRDERKQNKIVTVLSKIEAVIGERKRELELLDELVKARFIEMFGEPENNNKAWPVKSLDKLCTVGSSKRVYQSEQSSEGVPFWRISDLVSKIDTGTVDSELFISEIKYTELKRAGLVPVTGDILVTSRGTLGRCYIVHDEDCFYFQDGMISWLSNYSEEITPLYLQYLFTMSGFRKQIDNAQAGSTVAYLSIAMLKKLQVMVPNKALQEQFAAFVEQVDKSKLIIQKNLDELETLNKALMQKYFGGNEVR